MISEITKDGEKQKIEVEKLFSKYKYRKNKDYESNPISVEFYVRGKDIEVFEDRVIYIEYELHITYEHTYTYEQKKEIVKFHTRLFINTKSNRNKYYVNSYDIKSVDDLKNMLDNHSPVRGDTDGIKQKMMYSNFFKETRVNLREGGGKVGYLTVLKIQPELTYLVYKDEEIKKTLITLRKQLEGLVILSKV